MHYTTLHCTALHCTACKPHPRPQATKAVHIRRASEAPGEDATHHAERPHFAAWGMYQFTNPFITCPPGQTFGKVQLETGALLGKASLPHTVHGGSTCAHRIACCHGMQFGGIMYPLGNGQEYMDGHKYLCGMETLQAPCTILSLGRCGTTEGDTLNQDS
jgi:hypothetical protein